MILNALKFFWKNINTFLLALSLSIVIWVSAVISSDPNVENEYPIPITIQFRNLSDGFIVVGDFDVETMLRIRAPESVWEELIKHPEAVNAYIDLQGFSIGTYSLPLEFVISQQPTRVVAASPSSIEFSIENEVYAEWEIEANIIGEPALGYQLDVLELSDEHVTISGPESKVSLIENVAVNVDVSQARGSISDTLVVTAFDKNGDLITGLNIVPSEINIKQSIKQAIGYRDVVVTVQTIGQLEVGYRVTSISVFPQTVTVSSSDPQLVNQMPGFVRTQPLDISNANDDIEVNLLLELPEGVVLESENQFVLVQVGIAAIESSISLKVPIQITNLNSGLTAKLSPEEVEVLLSGPVPILDTISLDDIVIAVDLADLGIGTHLTELQVVTIPERIVIDGINPESIEVEIMFSDSNSLYANYYFSLPVQ